MSVGIDPEAAQSEQASFLQRLALDANADARSVRRAYARELKLIDQEHDVVQFQDLRLAYELALEWAEFRDGDGRDASARGGRPPAAFDAPLAEETASDGAQDPSAQDTADRALERFASASEALRTHGAADDPAAWIECLEHTLDDAGMINLAARAGFESRIACLLADGWRPGHESLFGAACSVFDWTRDHRRVRSLGESGAVLCRAIDECMMAQAQPPAVLAAQLKAAARLRDPRRPTKGEIVDIMQHIEDLLARYPAWLSMISNVANIAIWREASTDVRGWRRTQVSNPGAVHARAGAANNWWTLVAAIVMLLNILSRCSGN
ncbi:MAG: hypothetical protein V4582_23505 [Pseudomonadota bacterium]